MDDQMSLWVGGAVSAGAHLVFGALLLGGSVAPRPRLPPSAVSIEVVAPAPPEPAPPREEPEPRERASAPAARATAPPPPTAPAPTTPAPPAESGPVDLGGVTLTNDGSGASWAAPAGNVAVKPSVPRALTATAPPRAAPSVPSTVAAADLSQKPAPPALDGALARNYPPELRRRGVGGVAVVRVRIEPDGSVRIASVVSETQSGFGDACRRTVLGSRWVAPRDRSGRPAATFVSYTCRFRVDGG
jgi:TonB family protein